MVTLSCSQLNVEVKFTKRMKRFNSIMLYGVFLLLYIILLLYSLIFKNISPFELFDSNRVYYRSVNVMPFYTIISYLSGSQNVPPIVVLSNIFGNIILFVPFGIYFQILYKRKIRNNMLIIFLITMFVEMFQFIFGLGAIDVDDIILNCSGGLVGILVYKILSYFMKNEEKVQTIIVLTGLIVIMLPVLFSFMVGFRFRLE